MPVDLVVVVGGGLKEAEGLGPWGGRGRRLRMGGLGAQEDGERGRGDEGMGDGGGWRRGWDKHKGTRATERANSGAPPPFRIIFMLVHEMALRVSAKPNLLP